MQNTQRGQTHKKVELSNETYALLVEFKSMVFLKRSRQGIYENPDFNEALKISLKESIKKFIEENEANEYDGN